MRREQFEVKSSEVLPAEGDGQSSVRLVRKGVGGKDFGEVGAKWGLGGAIWWEEDAEWRLFGGI